MSQSATPTGDRVLVLTSSYPRFLGDAAGHFVASEVKNLRTAGHQVTVLVGGQGNVHDSTVHFLGAASLFDAPGALQRARRNPTRLLGLLSSTSKLKVIARNAGKFDRIIAHWLVPGAAPWALFWPDQLPLEIVCHGSDVRLLMQLPAPFRLALLRSFVRRGATLRFVSHQLKQELASSSLPQDLWRFIEGASVVASPIDCGPPISQTEARRQLKLDLDCQLAVLVGRLIPSKRVEVALRAAELVPELHIAVVGSGPLEAQLKADFPEVRFVGQLLREETLRWIAAADLLLTASRTEGAPTVIREARRLGTPVVTPPAGDAKLWAQHDSALWVVD